MNPGGLPNSGAIISADEIEMEIREFLSSQESGGGSGLYHGVMGTVERILIAKALSVTERNQVQASKLLGINRLTLRKKIQKYKLVDRGKNR